MNRAGLATSFRGIALGLDRFKAWTNYWCDRVIDRSDSILIEFEGTRPLWLKPIRKWFARWFGTLCWLWRDLPRQDVYDLRGDGWRIRVVGQNADVADIGYLFFGEEWPEIRQVGRVAVWRLRKRAREWLAAGGDLVVCRTAYGSPFRVGGPRTFVLPNRVEQCLDLDIPVSVSLAGRRGRGIRTRINRAERAGFSYRFTQRVEDFEHFYQAMYLPFISSRHGRLASVSPYAQLRAYFDAGGLLLVTRNGLDVAGTVCYMQGDVFYGVEEGILNNDAELIQFGVNAYIYWCSYLWAQEHHARLFNMGPSYAMASDGPFDFKAHWGARVMRRRRLINYWEMCIGRLDEAQRNAFNALGWITDRAGEFYRVWLVDGDGMEGNLSPDEDLIVRSGLKGFLLLREAKAYTLIPEPSHSSGADARVCDSV